MKTRVNLRIQAELWEQVQARAAEFRRTTTSVVEEALEVVLSRYDHGPGYDPPLRDAAIREAYESPVLGRQRQSKLPPVVFGDDVDRGPSIPEHAAAMRAAEAPQRYACPMRGCGFSAPSKAARCPVHGRTVS